MSTVAGVIFATALVACGGDDEAPSKAEYIEKADAVCAEADPKLDDIWRTKIAKAPDAKGAQAGLQALLPEERKLLEELRALEKPDGDDGESVDRIWDARETAVDAMEAAARRPETAQAYANADDPPAYELTERLASEYGMVDCAAVQPGSVAG